MWRAVLQRRLAIQTLLDTILNFSIAHPGLASMMTTAFRWIFVALALYILTVSIVSLLSTRTTPEVWGYFLVEDGSNYPITHWENVIGRSGSADINIPLKTISNNHALLNRTDEGKWIFKDLGSKNGAMINGYKIEPNKRYLISPGDEIVMGDVHCTVAPASLEESMNNRGMRLLDKEPVAPWKILVAITVFQALTIVQLILGMGTEITASAILSIAILCGIMWAYVSFFRAMGRKGFEMEMIAFFMTTINLAVMASFNPSDTPKQLIAAIMGIALMIFMCIYLQDLQRTRKLKPIVIGLSVMLFIINLIFGTMKYGAANWIYIGDYSFQPSEIIKLAFVLVGAGVLEELYDKMNTYVYAGFLCSASDASR